MIVPHYSEERIDQGAHLIPPRMIGGVKRYVLHGIPPGNFLTAVLSNDLREAFACADDENAARMHDWVRFFYNHVPTGCWGAPDKVRKWRGVEQEQPA